MSAVIAALDGGPGTGPVRDVAQALAGRLGCDLEVVCVGPAESGADLEAARVEIGDPARVLSEEAARTDVQAIVVGTRHAEGGAYPAGHVTLALLLTSPVLVVVVPPDLPRESRSLSRVLVPVEGNGPISDAAESLVNRLRASGAEVVPVHVLDQAHTPAFLEGWDDLHQYAEEFTRRYAPELDKAELRVGDPATAILDCLRDKDADAALLEWKQQLSEGRAHVVRSLLERSTRPLLLLPERLEESP
jgi:nucleotide-binding universal stress UspA family protein